MMDREM